MDYVDLVNNLLFSNTGHLETINQLKLHPIHSLYLLRCLIFLVMHYGFNSHFSLNESKSASLKMC